MGPLNHRAPYHLTAIFIYYIVLMIVIIIPHKHEVVSAHVKQCNKMNRPLFYKNNNIYYNKFNNINIQ